MVSFGAVLPALKTIGTKIGSSAISIGKTIGSKLGSGLSSIGSYIKENPSSLFSIGSNFMGLFGSSSNSAKKSFEYSKALQQHQYELERKSRQTAYQDTRQSLEEAGYNPLLAVGQQSGSLPVGNQMSVTDPETERLQNSVALANAIAELKKKYAETENIKTDTELKPYDKPLKVIGDLLQGKNSRVANSAKSVLGSVVGLSTNSANSAINQFSQSHPTFRRAAKKFIHGDFKGAGYEIGYRLAHRYKSKSSAYSSQSQLKSQRPPEIPANWWYEGEPTGVYR